MAPKSGVKRRSDSVESVEPATDAGWERKKPCIDIEATALVGQRVKVWWDGNHAYEGAVVSFNEDHWTYRVRYDDGEECEELLVLEHVMVHRVPWPRPTSAQLVQLGAYLMSKSEEVEQAKPPGRSGRFRNVEGAQRSKMIVQCARLAMQIADVYEAEEHIQQGQGQQQQQQSEQAGPAGQAAADDAGNHESGQLQEEGSRSRRGKRQRSNSVESVGTRGTRSKPVSGALPGMGADKDVPSGKQAEAQPLASQEHAAGAPLATAAGPSQGVVAGALGSSTGGQQPLWQGSEEEARHQDQEQPWQAAGDGCAALDAQALGVMPPASGFDAQPHAEPPVPPGSAPQSAPAPELVQSAIDLDPSPGGFTSMLFDDELPAPAPVAEAQHGMPPLPSVPAPAPAAIPPSVPGMTASAVQLHGVHMTSAGVGAAAGAAAAPTAGQQASRGVSGPSQVAAKPAAPATVLSNSRLMEILLKCTKPGGAAPPSNAAPATAVGTGLGALSHAPVPPPAPAPLRPATDTGVVSVGVAAAPAQQHVQQPAATPPPAASISGPAATAVAVPASAPGTARQQQSRDQQAQAAQAAGQQAVADAYQDAPELMEWVAGVPDPDIVAKVTAWGQRLSGVISDVPLPNTPEGTPTVPVKEALDIIKELEKQPVTLTLLENSQICKAVAMLRSHRNLHVAQQANQLSAAWRATAVAALQRANAGISTGPKRGNKRLPRDAPSAAAGPAAAGPAPPAPAAVQ